MIGPKGDEGRTADSTVMAKPPALPVAVQSVIALCRRHV